MIDLVNIGGDLTGVSSNVALINNALLTDDVILQNGFCLIDSAILIPSNRTLFIKNCRVRVADSTYDNVFRNLDPVGGNDNVHVIGLGGAVIDGNAANNYSLDYAIYGTLVYDITNYNSYKDHTLYKANEFFFCNVTNYSVKNLTFVDHKHYISFVQQCSYGLYENLYFNHYTTTRNQDGIAIAYGSHHLTFKNMHGYTGDDFVSIFLGTTRGGLFYPLPNFTIGDTHDIVWDNMVIWSQYHSLIFINGDGNKIYNILFKDVHVIRNSFLTYFGINLYNTVSNTQDELKDIDFENIYVQANTSPSVIEFTKDCKNINISNFTNDSGKSDYIRNSGVQSNVELNGTLIFP